MSVLSRVIGLGLTGVVAYTAFQWGGVVRTGRYGYLLALGLLAVVASLAISRREAAPRPDGLVRWAAALLPAYVLFQAIPLPVAVLRVLSPARAEMVDALGPAGAKVSFASLSVFPAGTFQYFLLVCGYVVIFLLARELMWRLEDRQWLAAWPVIGIAALEAALGMWQFFGGMGEELGRGTYVNRNHYAGFLEMALPFAVMYPVAALGRGRSRRHSPVAPAVAACGVWALAGLMLAGIVYSFSRMGFVAALFSLLVMGALALGYRKPSWVAAGLVVLLAAGFIFLPPDRLIERFAELASGDELSGGGRTALWAETIPLIRAYILTGCGLGGYETAFYRFKNSGPLVTDDFAHNDYLQLLSELGVPGFLMVAVTALWVAGKAVRGAVGSPDPERRYFAVACAGALGAILLHSTVDFNLYIPANAMLLSWIAGMTAGLGMDAWKGISYPKAITVEADSPRQTYR